MNQLLLLLVLTLPAIALSPAPNPSSGKAPLLDKLHQRCAKNSQADATSQEAVCDCLKKNYDKGLSRLQLETLVKVQDGSLDKSELAREDHQAVVDFDFEVAEKCLENNKWIWEAPKPSAAPSPAAAPAKKKN